jgi:hypothetical protein
MRYSYDRTAYADVSMADAQHAYMDDLTKDVMKALTDRRYKVNLQGKYGWSIIGIASTHRIRVSLDLLDNGIIRSGVTSAPPGSTSFPLASGIEWDSTTKAGAIVKDLMKMLQTETAKYVKR